MIWILRFLVGWAPSHNVVTSNSYAEKYKIGYHCQRYFDPCSSGNVTSENHKLQRNRYKYMCDWMEQQCQQKQQRRQEQQKQKKEKEKKTKTI